jgi:1-acyl-sn-glycerol-3-phosphate acyltransferase
MFAWLIFTWIKMLYRKPTFGIKARTFTLWGIVGSYTVFILLTAIVTSRCNARTRNKLITTWTWLFNFCARNICGVKYEVIGRENIIDNPAIIASNHQSIWETLCFTQIFPQHVWVLKKEILKIPFFGWALKFAAPISIDRNDSYNAMTTVMEQGQDRFKQGFWILTFPEGTRLMPGQRKKYKIGTAKLAVLLDAPIIPVAHNAGHCYPKTGMCLYPGTVTVKICKPVYRTTDDLNLITKELETTINAELDRMGA